MNVNGAANPKTLTTPIWVLALRVAQFVLSIVVLGMAASWSSFGLFDGVDLAIAAVVFTWLIVAYIVVTEKVGAVNMLYNVYAVIVLDAYMVIIWLCTWALNASRRASIGNLGNFGGSGHGRNCYYGYCFDDKRRSLTRRATSLKTLTGLLTGVAVLGAFIWVLFIVTLVWTLMNVLKGRKDGRFPFGTSRTTNPGHAMEEQKPQPQGQQPQQYVQPQYTGQQQPMQTPYAGQPQGPQELQQQPGQPQYTGQEQQAYAQYPQEPSPAQYQTPQVGAQYQQPQQYPQDPHQITPPPQH